MTISSAQLADFDISIAQVGYDLPRHAVCETGVIVNGLDWDVLHGRDGEMDGHEAHALRNLQARGISNPDEWVVVASYYEDMTEWSDVECKWEFYGETHVLVVPRDVADGARVRFTYEDKAADAGYEEYAA
jgi:hypothetical protein